MGHWWFGAGTQSGLLQLVLVEPWHTALSIGQYRHNHSWGLFREPLTLLRASALRQWADYSNDVEADDFGNYRRDYEGGR